MSSRRSLKEPGAPNNILTSFESIVDQKLAAIGFRTVQASLYVASQPNVSWPWVTMNAFQLRASVAREPYGALFARLVPVVVEETKEAWEASLLHGEPLVAG